MSKRNIRNSFKHKKKRKQSRILLKDCDLYKLKPQKITVAIEIKK